MVAAATGRPVAITTSPVVDRLGRFAIRTTIGLGLSPKPKVTSLMPMVGRQTR